ncbi:hypothetical protein FYJ91_18430 [Sphingomonas montanisoli]|uniref:Uncharacterized protein n=1 Tax=Sphingomonas montanisoli TaxID=2606412 RepID=A0A5D9C018_9SPHN|nr:hypothetical protein FYJ91_18430 [Sphingomonas montanisoli]
MVNATTIEGLSRQQRYEEDEQVAGLSEITASRFARLFNLFGNVVGLRKLVIDRISKRRVRWFFVLGAGVHGELLCREFYGATAVEAAEATATLDDPTPQPCRPYIVWITFCAYS